MKYNELHSEIMNWTSEQKYKFYDTLFIFSKVLELDELIEVGIASSKNIIMQYDRYIFTYQNNEILVINETWPLVQGWNILIHIDGVAQKINKTF